MEISLLKDVEGLGQRGGVVTVAGGYGRNYLLVKGFALLNTPGNRKILQEKEKIQRARMEKEKRGAERLAGSLEKISLTTVVQVGEEDRLFGSVTTEDISVLLKKEGFSMDKRKIQLPEPIKELGVYTISIKLHPEVEGKVKLWVVRE